MTTNENRNYCSDGFRTRTVGPVGRGMRTERHGLFEYTIGQLGGNTLYIMECGIGKVNAAVGASELMARMQPDVVVSTGVAGGIDAKAGVMEVGGFGGGLS